MKSPDLKFLAPSRTRQKELVKLDEEWLKQNQVFGWRNISKIHNLNTASLATSLGAAAEALYESEAQKAKLFNEHLILGPKEGERPLFIGIDANYVALVGIKYVSKLRKPTDMPFSSYSYRESLLIPRFSTYEPAIIRGDISSLGWLKPQVSETATRVANLADVEAANRLFLNKHIEYNRQQL